MPGRVLSGPEVQPAEAPARGLPPECLPEECPPPKWPPPEWPPPLPCSASAGVRRQITDSKIGRMRSDRTRKAVRVTMALPQCGSSLLLFGWLGVCDLCRLIHAGHGSSSAGGQGTVRKDSRLRFLRAKWVAETRPLACWIGTSVWRSGALRFSSERRVRSLTHTLRSPLMATGYGPTDRPRSCLSRHLSGRAVWSEGRPTTQPWTGGLTPPVLPQHERGSSGSAG